jgi:hypothetical protein
MQQNTDTNTDFEVRSLDAIVCKTKAFWSINGITI